MIGWKDMKTGTKCKKKQTVKCEKSKQKLTTTQH